MAEDIGERVIWTYPDNVYSLFYQQQTLLFFYPVPICWGYTERAFRTFMAIALFLCWECSFLATGRMMPVGIWVSLTADAVLLTCCPPAPEALKVSQLWYHLFEFDINIFFDFRKHRTSGKRCMPSFPCIERISDKSVTLPRISKYRMHMGRLWLSVALFIPASSPHLQFDNLHAKFMPFSPPRYILIQHLRPVLAFCSACPGWIVRMALFLSISPKGDA